MPENPTTSKPIAWYGGSWAYSDPDPEEEPAPPPDPRSAWEERRAQFDPDVFGAESLPGSGRGLVVGRFQPPHRGHELVIRFALSFVRDLSLLVRVSPGDSLPAELRVAWLRELFPSVWVQTIPDPPDLAPGDEEELARHWTEVIRAELLPPSFVFGSDPTAGKLAERLSARYVPVDPARRLVPVSGTQVREQPLVHWRFLPPCVRAHYALRVSLVGAEGTGKTTLARRLAKHYGTVATAEYPRTLREADEDFAWSVADTQVIARAQLAQEAALARQANRVLFCDTDLLSVQLWSERLFGGAPEWIRSRGAARDRLYLVLDGATPEHAGWEDERALFQERLLEELRARDASYVHLTGDWTERQTRAIAAVDALLPPELRER